MRLGNQATNTMKSFTLRLGDLLQLNEIQETIKHNQQLSTQQLRVIEYFLKQLPFAQHLKIEAASFDDEITLNLINDPILQDTVNDWQQLFTNIPGWDFCPLCHFVDNDDIELVNKNIILVANFSPSYAYNLIPEARAYEVRLKGDGTATFWVPTKEDENKYPELLQFKGTWKEAYTHLIATLQKGWPKEEFPQELRKYLP